MKTQNVIIFKFLSQPQPFYVFRIVSEVYVNDIIFRRDVSENGKLDVSIKNETKLNSSHDKVASS